MKIKHFIAPNNHIQKPEQIKLKNLLLGEKNYLLSFKKLRVLNHLTPHTRLEPSIKSGRTMFTIKPMLGRTYRSTRFILDSIKDQKVAFSKKLPRALTDPVEAHSLKKKFQGELLEARLNLRIRRRRKRYIKRRFSPLKPPHWFEFKNPKHRLNWVKKSKNQNLVKLHKKVNRKLNNRFIKVKRVRADLKIGKSTTKRWLVIHNLRTN